MVRRLVRVLVADAEPNFARVLTLALEKRGCQVHIATDGLEAVSRVREKPYDLAIVDAALPVMDGLQVMTLCADVRPRLPVIITSTYDASDLRQQATEGGAYAFVVKPSDGVRLAWLAEQAFGAKIGRRAVSRSPLATLRRLEPGQRVVLSVATGPHPGRYSSTFLERHSRFLVVSGPRSARGQGSLAVGARMTMEFGLRDGWYAFSTRVVGHDLHHRPPALLLQPPKSVSRRQRRKHVRVPVAIPVGYGVVGHGGRVARTASEDLGLGGMRLLAGRRLEVGTPLAVLLRPGPGPREISVSGEVIWAERHGRRWRTGIRFSAPSSNLRRLQARLMGAVHGVRTE